MKRILCVLLSASLVFVFASCSDNSSTSEVNSTSANTTQASKTSATTENTPEADGNYDLSFSNRDCDSSYDNNSCKITFSNSSAKADSQNGVAINESDVTITAEGTYILSGESTDGSVTIDTEDKSKVQLVLDNLNLTSKNSPLVIKEADKVFITLADGSTNTLSDASSYSLTIDGKDCVKIKSATVTVDSGTDSIRSTNIDETDTRGFVYIYSGSFMLKSENDAVQAASMLRIDGGDFEITSGGGSMNGGGMNSPNGDMRGGPGGMMPR